MLAWNQYLRNYLNLTVIIIFSTGPLKGSTGTCTLILISKLPTYRNSYMRMHLCSFTRDIAMKIVESEYWREALRSCHFVVEDPPTQHSPQGASPAVNPQGASPAVNPQGPPPAVNPQGPPPAVNPQGPPLVVNPHGPPPAVNPQGPPPAVNSPGIPPAKRIFCQNAKAPYVCNSTWVFHQSTLFDHYQVWLQALGQSRHSCKYVIFCGHFHY